MLCSVIIPLYNKAPYIADAIASVINQTHQEFEIIVVDDGSTDHGAEIVRGIQDPRVRLIQQPNGGVSRARNCGIAAATGDLVSFLDADDWYGPAYLAVMTQLAKARPDIVFFAAAYKWLRESGSGDWSEALPAQLPTEVVTDYYARRMRSGVLGHTNSITVRRRELQAMQPCFPVGESHGEDLDLWFRLGERYPLLYCPLELVGYRRDVEGSLITTQPRQHLLPVFERVEQRAKRGEMPSAVRRSALRMAGEARVGLARTHLAQGNRKAALAELWRGRHAAPRRWLVSLLMIGLFSPTLSRQWIKWRHERAHPDRG